MGQRKGEITAVNEQFLLHNSFFLAATKQLYEWYFLSVRPSVWLSVRLSVRPSVRRRIWPRLGVSGM